MSSPSTPPDTAPAFEICSLAKAAFDVDALDPEIFPYFEEEARQELHEIENELHLLYEQSGDAKRVLTDMRRQFHTLKGSANSVGHLRIGAIAHAMKIQVEKALESGVAGSPRDFAKLILEVIALLQKLLQEARDPEHSPVAPAEVFRVAETIRDYPLPRRRPCARLHLP